MFNFNLEKLIKDGLTFLSEYKRFENLPFKGGMIVTQGFGLTPFAQKNPEYYKAVGGIHRGHDLIPLWHRHPSLQVNSVANGKVVQERAIYGPDAYGIYVCIWHPRLRLGTWYCHLEKNIVSVGQEVKAGQIIGNMGGTGTKRDSFKKHLHFGVVETDDNGYRINRDNGADGFISPTRFYLHLLNKSAKLSLKEDGEKF